MKTNFLIAIVCFLGIAIALTITFSKKGKEQQTENSILIVFDYGDNPYQGSMLVRTPYCDGTHTYTNEDFPNGSIVNNANKKIIGNFNTGLSMEKNNGAGYLKGQAKYFPQGSLYAVPRNASMILKVK